MSPRVSHLLIVGERLTRKRKLKNPKKIHGGEDRDASIVLKSYIANDLEALRAFFRHAERGDFVSFVRWRR